MTKAQAAAEYLRLVTPGNAAATRFSKYADHHDSDLKGLKTRAAGVAKAEWALARALQARKWPANTQPLMTKMIAEIADEVDSWRSAARARNFTQMNYVLERMKNPSTPNRVRLSLGLPPR